MTTDQWKRWRPVLTEAIALDPSERDRFLQSAFGGDSGLRDELAKVLHAHGAATLRLRKRRTNTESRQPHSRSMVPDSQGRANSAPGDAPFLSPGDMCGQYRVVRLLGAGGMGQVYLAEDVDLGTPTALKLVSSALLDSAEARARLRREAARAAQLRYHAHIATVLHFLELEVKGRNLPVLVMEYVPGRPASHLVADGAIACDRAIGWAIQIARAMEFAHEHEVVHCDLKPANVHVDQRPTGDFVKVLDFGIARAAVEGASSDNAGTPPYMAPERLTGSDCNKSADVYALGVTLFELVTGRRPYAAGTLEDLALQVLAAPVPTASALAPAVPRALDDILRRAMAKDPERRYASMTEFRQALEALLPSRTGSHWQWYAGAVAAALAFISILGFASTHALDQGLGRVAEFRLSSPVTWFYWGVRSLVAPLAFSATLLLAMLCVASVVRLCACLPPIKPHVDRVMAPLRERLDALSLVSTSTLAQILLLTHVALLVAAVVYFAPLLESFMNFMTASRGSIEALGPSNLWMHEMYGYFVTAELLVFCIAWYRLLRLRAQRSEREGLAYIAAGIAAIGVSAFLFTARFQILSHNASERVLYSGDTCYLVDERGSTALLFCPLAYPRTVMANTSNIERTGRIESIFSPLDR